MSPVRECTRSAEQHIGIGTNVRGVGPSPYDPHAHPFGGADGLVACCTTGPGCQIEGHLTLDHGDIRHAALEARS